MLMVDAPGLLVIVALSTTATKAVAKGNLVVLTSKRHVLRLAINQLVKVILVARGQIPLKIAQSLMKQPVVLLADVRKILMIVLTIQMAVEMALRVTPRTVAGIARMIVVQAHVRAALGTLVVPAPMTLILV